jgi:hypothetical protein
MANLMARNVALNRRRNPVKATLSKMQRKAVSATFAYQVCVMEILRLWF